MTTQEPAEFADEEVMFRKDGTIIWRVDGQRCVLRRPKFKELRALNEEIAELAATSRERREPLQERLRALTDPLTEQIATLSEGDDEATTQQIAAAQAELRRVQQSDEFADVQAALRKQRDESDDDLMAWFYESVLCRFAKPVPSVEEPGDLPPWCIRPEFTRELLEHWSSVPRRPGVV